MRVPQWFITAVIVAAALIGFGMHTQAILSDLRQADKDGATGRAMLENTVQDLARRVCVLETRGGAVDTKCPTYLWEGDSLP